MHVENCCSCNYFALSDLQEQYPVKVSLFPTKLGRCMTFNSEITSKLFNIERAGIQFHYDRFFDASDLVFDRFVPDLGNHLYHTSHTDLGLEMDLFEGTNHLFLKHKYENFGFKIMVHSPYEVPDETVHYYTISLNQSYLFSIKPQLKNIDESLIEMSPQE